jgi:hypothetical protein
LNASKSGPMKELLPDDRTGWIVTSEDLEAALAVVHR